jgi:hypothetical protein
MKHFVFASIILILASLAFIGCSRVQNQASTLPERESKDGTTVGQKEVSTEPDNTITVYKSPSCGCCKGWESHLSNAGFNVISKPTENMAGIRKEFGVPENMESCHTALINGYVIEGHVPAADIRRLLETRPSVAGLAAPGMPPKSPGMQPEGEKPAGYDVLSFDREGNSTVFASY